MNTNLVIKFTYLRLRNEVQTGYKDASDKLLRNHPHVTKTQ